MGRPHDTYVFFNHSGNGFSKEPVILYGVSGQAASTAGVVDAFGRGTPQIVYSLNKWQNVNCHLRATDLIGDTKPYLLTAVKNNFGLETRIKYAPSTKFYLADKAAGTPWAHPLPFPVHVVERVEVYDAVKKHRFVQEYTYHHGGYDPDEREFRGFGRVETLDTEYTAAHEGKGLFGDLPIFNNEPPQSPVLTKTWFHLGILRHWALYNQAYQREWWRPTVDLGSPEAPPNLLGRPVVLAEQTSPVTLTQRHEAYRAMRGQTMRVEVYGLDGSENDTVPVQVAKTRIRIVQKQGPRGGRGVTANHCVMLVHPEEAVTIHYEKNQDDPRIAHTLTLAVDEYGVPTRQATVVYGRKVPAPPPGQPPVESFPEQLSTHVVVGTRQVAHFPFGSGSTPTKHRLAVPLAEQSFELKMPTAPAAANGLYTLPTSTPRLTAPLRYRTKTSPPPAKNASSALPSTSITTPQTYPTRSRKARPMFWRYLTNRTLWPSLPALFHKPTAQKSTALCWSPPVTKTAAPMAIGSSQAVRCLTLPIFISRPKSLTRSAA
ncbi:MAG: hypothetical protein IPK82_21690 [Polyangiaceae bacterium]|nr:hypothetical protein [Polyangiaceae bacterium]